MEGLKQYWQKRKKQQEARKIKSAGADSWLKRKRVAKNPIKYQTNWSIHIFPTRHNPPECRGYDKVSRNSGGST